MYAPRATLCERRLSPQVFVLEVEVQLIGAFPDDDGPILLLQLRVLRTAGALLLVTRPSRQVDPRELNSSLLVGEVDARRLLALGLIRRCSAHIQRGCVPRAVIRLCLLSVFSIDDLLALPAILRLDVLDVVDLFGLVDVLLHEVLRKLLPGTMVVALAEGGRNLRFGNRLAWRAWRFDSLGSLRHFHLPMDLLPRTGNLAGKRCTAQDKGRRRFDPGGGQAVSRRLRQRHSVLRQPQRHQRLHRRLASPAPSEASMELPDEGIWEVRGPRRHFVHSKVMAWTAVDRAVRLIEAGHAHGPVARWRKLRAAIHQDVCEKGFDRDRNTFTQSYGSTRLDAALLVILQVGFLPPDDKRVIGTVEAIQRELSTRDGFLLRYTTDGARTGEDGLPGDEGAFLLCSFGLVEALATIGRLDEAHALFDRLLRLRNDVGLLAEEWDPHLQRQTGNFPQAFSHIGLVNAALALSRYSGASTAEEVPVQSANGQGIPCGAAALGGALL